MEEILTLVINDDIRLPVESFSETLIDAHKETKRPEVHIKLKGINAVEDEDLQKLFTIVINNLELYKNGLSIWTSSNYSKILRMGLDISGEMVEYSLIFI